MKYERRHEPLAPREVFAHRLLRSVLLGLALVGASLAVGMAGYAGFEGMGWMDAFLNASLLLSGMGPLHSPATTAGKLFVGCYAIYCGFAVLGTAVFVFAPVVHRFLHSFHIEGKETQEKGKNPQAKGKK